MSRVGCGGVASQAISLMVSLVRVASPRRGPEGGVLRERRVDSGAERRGEGADGVGSGCETRGRDGQSGEGLRNEGKGRTGWGGAERRGEGT